MLGNEHLERELANVASLVQTAMKENQRISKLLLQPTQPQGNIHVLDPHKVSRAEFKALAERVEKLTALMTENSTRAFDAIHKLQGIVEGVADDLGTLMVKVDERLASSTDED
jgi:hypothetical protein